MMDVQHSETGRVEAGASLPTAGKNYLIVGSTPFSRWQRILPLFTHAGISVADSALVRDWSQAPVSKAACERLLETCDAPSVIDAGDVTTPESLEFWISEFADTHLLLLHTRPESRLAEAMEKRLDPVTALDEWRAAARKLLQVFRRNRRRVTLVDVDCVIAAPNVFLQWCDTYLGLKSTRWAGQDSPGPDRDFHLYQLIANQIVAQSSETQALLSELEACSLPIGDPSRPCIIDCRAAYHNHIDLLSRSQATRVWNKKQLANAQHENEVLMQQLHQTQKELEALYFHYEEKAKGTEKEAEYLEKLDLCEERLKDSLSRIQQLEERTAIREHHMDYMTHSRSWRYTAPFRAIYRRLFYKPPE